MNLLDHFIFLIFLNVQNYAVWHLKIKYISANLNKNHFIFTITVFLKDKKI